MVLEKHSLLENLSDDEIINFYNSIIEFLIMCSCKHVMRTKSVNWAIADFANVLELLNIRGFRASVVDSKVVFKEF
jgi:hypothetical protein